MSAAAALAASALLAGAGAGHEVDYWALGWLAFNLALLVGVVAFFGRRAIVRFFRARARQIRAAVDAAQQALAQSKARIATAAERQAALPRQLEEARARTEQYLADQERVRLAAAASEAERIHRDARLSLERERQRQHELIRQRLLREAFEQLERRLAASADAGLHQERLVELHAALAAQARHLLGSPDEGRP